MSFTGIVDIDREILLDLPYTDLVEVCKVNKAVRAICADTFFWKIRTEREYGPYALPQDADYSQQYRFLKYLRADSELFQKYSEYREAFNELREDPDIFGLELEQNPDYTLTDYFLEYGDVDLPFVKAQHLLKKGKYITAGVYRQMTALPNFGTELNAMAGLAAQYPQFYEVGELFASAPATTELRFTLQEDQMVIEASNYDTEPLVVVKTTVPTDAGYDVVKRLIDVPFIVFGEGDEEITGI